MIEILCLGIIGLLVADHNKRIKTLRNEIRNYGKQSA